MENYFIESELVTQHLYEYFDNCFAYSINKMDLSNMLRNIVSV